MTIFHPLRPLVFDAKERSSFAAPIAHFVLSGRRESNPVFTHPKRTYYRYTTARFRRVTGAPYRIRTYDLSNVNRTL